jgi:hypothetical protein
MESCVVSVIMAAVWTLEVPESPSPCRVALVAAS